MFSHLLVACLAATAFAQQPAATPKKDPFAGFGNTGLDRRKPGEPTSSPFSKPMATPAPTTRTTFAPETGSQTGTGIVLSKGWQGHMAQAAGGQTMKLDDLRALLTRFGKAEADIAAHSDVTVYEGPRMDGEPGSARITYLMPLSQAEALLFKSRGITTSSRAVAPGLPDGLLLRTYDVRAGIYNRLCIVADGAKPEPQVVSMVLKAEGKNWHPPVPFRKIERDWHTFDFVNTENRGSEGIKIDLRVNDARSSHGHIVVNTTGRNIPLPEVLPPPGILYKPAKASPKETTTWLVPGPLIRLMLYCLENQLGN
jgi:hypothetical protein